MALYTDLNIDLTDEQITIKEETHKFAKEVLRPAGPVIDEMSAEDAIAPESPLWMSIPLINTFPSEG